MTKEESILLKHFEDLSKTAHNRGFPKYSGFLTLHEQSLLDENYGKNKLFSKYTFVGGYDYAERKMACFYDETLHDKHPIEILLSKPLNAKFSDILTHRDYLGAIMNLGIERDVIGDIIKITDSDTYIICKDTIADYIIDNCNMVKHTSVFFERVYSDESDKLSIVPCFEEITGSVSSFRLDCILALGFRKSRTQVNDLIKSGNVFVNSRMTENSSYQLKPGDTVSARGFGKFVFAESGGLSKKGKTYVILKKFT